jgi:hypothetical protein
MVSDKGSGGVICGCVVIFKIPVAYNSLVPRF